MKHARYRHLLSLVALLASGCGKQVSLSDTDTGNTLCISYYAQCIDPILRNNLPASGTSCSASTGCHYRQDAADGSTIAEGVGGRFKINPAASTSVEIEKNYVSAKGMSTAGPASLILTKPLADGVTHVGGDLFASTSDASYQRILYWLSNVVENRGNVNPALDTQQCAAVLANNPCP